MAYFPTEKKYLCLGKESPRGTGVAPTRYIAVYPDSEMNYGLALIDDELVRGLPERYAPQSGVKSGTGTIRLDVQSNNIGELLYSLLGATTPSLVGPSTAYKHDFSKVNAVTHQSYTIHLARDLATLQYPFSVVKSITFTKTVDGKLIADVEVLFKTEEAEGFTPSPTWTSPTPFMFYQCTVKIAGGANLTAVKEWSVTIDNQSIAQRVLSTSQDPVDILTMMKLLVSGTMTVYFEDVTERDKFLANTVTTLEFLLEGSIIETTFKNTLDILMEEIHYTAFPYGDADGLLAAAVTFNAYYKIASAATVKIYLINTETTY